MPRPFDWRLRIVLHSFLDIEVVSGGRETTLIFGKSFVDIASLSVIAANRDCRFRRFWHLSSKLIQCLGCLSGLAVVRYQVGQIDVKLRGIGTIPNSRP